MGAQLGLAFLAGLVSFVTPCVLPLVPGYPSALSGTEVGATGMRVVAASVPFVAGFALVFVLLGVAAAAVGGLVDENRRLFLEAAGIVVVVLGFAFMGLLPVPFLERLAAPQLVEGARRSGSNALLGAAFGFCAAPCVGPVLAAILALASERGTVARGALLLLVYSAGLAIPFLLAGVAFTRAMTAFRWLRDRYAVFRTAAGAVLVAVGLLLFFDRLWWLNAAVNRAFRAAGIAA